MSASAAIAQDYLGSFLQSQQDANIREIQQEGRNSPKNGQQGHDQAKPPTRHQRACAQRYRTYDARTNTYLARPGIRTRCRL